jgi:phage baseplate assembly protein V
VASHGAAGERTLANDAAQDESQAEALAQAELDSRTARAITLHGLAEGNPALRPGRCVTVSGLAGHLCGRYVLTCVTHTVDCDRGYLSEISTLPPPARRRTGTAVAAPGVVTAVNDPERLGRVQVRLPSYGDLETGWIGVVTVAAGPNKGFVALPDAGDQVLVMFPHEDPAQGVVLGGLYGAVGPPDAGVRDGSVRRYTLLAPGGQRFVLDDDAGSVRFENGTGSFVELSPEAVTLHAAANLVIEAPGNQVVIQGQNVDFRRV